MTEKQILEKAISIAVKNGWKPPYKNKIRVQDAPDFKLIEFCHSQEVFETWEYYTLLFNHDFAKAVWGPRMTHRAEVPFPHMGELYIDAEGWQHHLQRMVLASNPIKYLTDNLPDEKL